MHNKTHTRSQTQKRIFGSEKSLAYVQYMLGFLSQIPAAFHGSQPSFILTHRAPEHGEAAAS